MIRPYLHIPLALGVVFVGSADFDLTATDASGHVVERICAKDGPSCERAIGAVRLGLWASDLRPLVLRCAPSPECFTPRSDVICGFNDRWECAR